jgi:hypothetical protein
MVGVLSLCCSVMILGMERPAVETAGYICEVRLRGLSLLKMVCGCEREYAHVSAW